MKQWILCSFLVVVACEPQTVGETKQRQILTEPQASGWMRVELDGEAQREREGLWVGDSNGRSVPFLFEDSQTWQPQALDLQDPLFGKDESGRPSAEFGVKYPSGWAIGEREHLRVELEVAAADNYVARVMVERRQEGGAWILSDEVHHIYELGSAGRRDWISIPWDAQRYRLQVQVSQGSIDKIAGLQVTAQTVPEESKPLRVSASSLARDEKNAGSWKVELPQAERVVGLDVVVAPPIAPVPLSVSVVSQTERGESRNPVATGSLVWNLPAVESQQSRVSIDPVVGASFVLEAPAGVALDRVEFLVVREKLIFPAEQGATYFVHLGGLANAAPGNLQALPSSRVLHQKPPLALGPAQSDPHGIARQITTSERTRPWLVWVVIAIVGALAVVALRLLKSSSKAADPQHPSQ